MSKLIWVLMWLGDLDEDDIIDKGAAYIIGQVLDFAEALTLARRMELLPKKWKPFRKACKKLANLVKEHGTPTKPSVRAALK